MSIKEVLDYSIKEKMIDLQALIIFLTMEKKVLTLDDDESELELYFLPKHRKRMNHLIGEFKQKMNMKYGIYIFVVNNEHYISAYDFKQAEMICFNENIAVKTIELVDPNTLVWDGDKNTTLRSLANNKTGLLGS